MILDEPLWAQNRAEDKPSLGPGATLKSIGFYWHDSWEKVSTHPIKKEEHKGTLSLMAKRCFSDSTRASWPQLLQDRDVFGFMLIHVMSIYLLLNIVKYC